MNDRPPWLFLALAFLVVCPGNPFAWATARVCPLSNAPGGPIPSLRQTFDEAELGIVPPPDRVIFAYSPQPEISEQGEIETYELTACV